MQIIFCATKFIAINLNPMPEVKYMQKIIDMVALNELLSIAYFQFKCFEVFRFIAVIVLYINLLLKKNPKINNDEWRE